MMVPRAYRYSSQAPPVPSRKCDEKNITVVPIAERITPKTPRKKEKNTTSTMPPTMFAPPPATPSQPVVIPTKSRKGGRRRSRETLAKDGRKSQAAETPHDESSTPSSVAALLAMTSLTQSAERFHSDKRRASTPVANRTPETRYRDTPRRAISSSSPQSWGVLLSPPEDSEQEIGSYESDTTLGPLSSLRSLSTESMPSLDTDTESLSSVSNPATPGMASSRNGADRRQKSLSTSVGEDCVLDHPLLPETPRAIEEEDEEPLEVLSTPPSAAAKARLAFTSNLTASFRKIRSAAQSFSAFTTPPTQREDYLARSLLGISPEFTDERRPFPSTEPPDPALRRYLNPITLSPSEFHFHPDQESSQAMRPNCTASIQLQAYKRPTRVSKKASSPPIFTTVDQKTIDAVDGLPQASTPRQREPRENSDFLRVIVLEMNMRKVGKLKDGSPGRAKLWLPARQDGKTVDDGKSDEVKGVPKRWAGVRA